MASPLLLALVLVAGALLAGWMGVDARASRSGLSVWMHATENFLIGRPDAGMRGSLYPPDPEIARYLSSLDHDELRLADFRTLRQTLEERVNRQRARFDALAGMRETHSVLAPSLRVLEQVLAACRSADGFSVETIDASSACDAPHVSVEIRLEVTGSAGAAESVADEALESLQGQGWCVDVRAEVDGSTVVVVATVVSGTEVDDG